MNKMKFRLVFTHMLMISTAILFGLGIYAAINFFAFGIESFTWHWYSLLAIIATGFLCAIPSVFLAGIEEMERRKFIVRVIIHFICIALIVSVCGYFFGWCENIREYFIMMLMYVCIYIFVWVATFHIMRTEDGKINKALDEIRDDE